VEIETSGEEKKKNEKETSGAAAAGDLITSYEPGRGLRGVLGEYLFDAVPSQAGPPSPPALLCPKAAGARQRNKAKVITIKDRG